VACVSGTVEVEKRQWLISNILCSMSGLCGEFDALSAVVCLFVAGLALSDIVAA
jgi:hypothetical protein